MDRQAGASMLDRGMIAGAAERLLPQAPHAARQPWEQAFLPRALLVACGAGASVLLMSDPLRTVIREWPGRWIQVLVTAFAVTATLVPLTIPLARRLGAMDLPDRRKIHATPTPRLGGLAIFAGILAAIAANGIPDRQLFAIGAAAWLLAVGAGDDARGLSARTRLAAQVAASLLVMQSGIVLTVLPDAWDTTGIANAFLTLLWLVGITNAFNFFDGMDGLAGGLAATMAAFLGSVAWLTGQPHLGWASAAVAGASLGFLPFNFRRGGPAKVFMGDGGSTMLGFVLAALAVHGAWGAGSPLTDLTAPLLIFGVLIYDMIHTTASRILRGDVRTLGQWIEFTGRDHLHHRLEALLRSKRKAVLLILVMQTTLGLSALLLRRLSLGGEVLVLLQCSAILLVVTILEHAGNLRERRGRSWDGE